MTRVARVACPDYASAREAFARVLALLGGAERFAARGEPLLIKPNLLTAHSPVDAVTTHPAIVEAALETASDLGARAVVADSPGLGSAEHVARVSGILAVCRRLGVPVIDLGSGGVSTASGRTYKAIEIATAALEARWIWNLPKWKTHTMMGLTLGVKNLFGCVPGKRKISAHFRVGSDVDSFARHLLDLWEVLKPCLTVLDGIVAMEGAGPSRGRPLRRGLVLASADAPALDWEATRLSGVDPRDVPTVRLSLEEGRVAPGALEVLGDPAEPLPFEAAAGSPCDWPLPRPVKRIVRNLVSPRPRFAVGRCTGCGICREACPAAALRPGTPPELSQESCIRCYCCQELCPSGAVTVSSRWLPGVFSLSGRRGRKQ